MGAPRTVCGAVSVVTALVLAACGSPTVSGVGPGDLSVDGPTTLSVAPAPERFRERANDVAAAVRQAGLPSRPTGLLLVSPWDAEAAFDTVDQKEAWGAGRVEVADSVAPDREPAATMTLPGGGTRRVGTIGVRAALERAFADASGTCGDSVPADRCRLEVTAARLSQAQVTTDGGAATVPAWELTVRGLARHPLVVATAPDVLAPAPRPSAPPGLGDPPGGLLSVSLLRAVDGETLEVTIFHGECEVDPHVNVVEGHDLVVVGGSYDEPPAGSVCTGVGLMTPATVRLSSPLGDRPVIDAVTGTPRYVGVPSY
ncbi:hypothetical protein [Intrasporangium sp. YIM S08009]|uniref:hypothetical protein n=1 Tax=Intrasporangium zincisolvens TaxID=3080018 RepID=UPI002B05E6F9|nr:hypothetical protein [Intrasporangium sp. YIM S08009]